MPADHATLSAPKARVEAAIGPDRALSREIQCILGGWHRVSPSKHGRGHKHPVFISPEDWLGEHPDGSPIISQSRDGTTLYREVPPVIGSMDAAWALVERQPEYQADPEGFFCKLGSANEGLGMDFGQPVGPQVAKGMLLALLTVKIAQLEETSHAR